MCTTFFCRVALLDSSTLLTCYELRSSEEKEVSVFAFLFVSGSVRESIDFFTLAADLGYEV